MKKDRFIVKVQIPIAASDGEEAMVLIYNEDRTKEGMISLTAKQFRELGQAMEGEPKAFFWAYLKNKHITLEEPAPWQSW